VVAAARPRTARTDQDTTTGEVIVGRPGRLSLVAVHRRDPWTHSHLLLVPGPFPAALPPESISNPDGIDGYHQYYRGPC
jgi:hypothetical protein